MSCSASTLPCVVFSNKRVAFTGLTGKTERVVGCVDILIYDNLTALSVGFVILGKDEYLNQES